MGQFSEAISQFDPGAAWKVLVPFTAWTVFILVLTWLAGKGIARAVADNTMCFHARKMVRLAGTLLIVLVALVSLTGRVQYVTLAVGLVSAGIVFVLQEVILSFAGWVAVFSARLYKPGDRIEINGMKGDVIDIGMTRTTLMEIGAWVNSDNYSGRIVHISNGFVFKGPVRNYSTDSPFVRDEITVPVRYGSDIDLAHRVILESAQRLLSDYVTFAARHWKVLLDKYLIEDARREPSMALTLTDNRLAFNLRYVVDYKKRRGTKDALFNAIGKVVSESGGRLALASATVELTAMPELQVRLREEK